VQSSRSPPSIRHPPGAYHNSAVSSMRHHITNRYEFFICFIISLITSSLHTQHYLMKIMTAAKTSICDVLTIMSRWKLIIA
jgi:hypothetical protein